MRRRIERSPLPDAAALRKLLAERAEELCDGGIVIDSDAQGATGLDMLLSDGSGRPVFVDVVGDQAACIPSRVFEHLAWLDRTRRLFLRAYAKDGVVNVEDPEILFVAERFPAAVQAALAAIPGVPARLIRAEYFTVDGEGELVLEELPVGSTEEPRRPARPSGGAPGDGQSRGVEKSIESESVRSLMALFRSGIDGLDGSIEEREEDGVVTFALGGMPHARVSASPGSFSVVPGETATNPIVVSDRVSLERALNAVVSLFVREGETGLERPPAGRSREIGETERAQLAGIWGSGIAGGENG
jgi:hypothetical protein